MLSASWYLCRYLMRRLAVARTVADRAAVGGIVFLLLLLAEMLLGALLFGRTPGEHWTLYSELSYALGLAARTNIRVLVLAQASRFNACRATPPAAARPGQTSQCGSARCRAKYPARAQLA
jgi:hypothetical protein